jgi:hypothetical protein
MTEGTSKCPHPPRFIHADFNQEAGFELAIPPYGLASLRMMPPFSKAAFVRKLPLSCVKFRLEYTRARMKHLAIFCGRLIRSLFY